MNKEHDQQEHAATDIEEQQVETASENPQANAQDTERRKMRRTTLGLLIAIILLFAWYLVSDRLTPYTTSARMKTFVIPIVPDVSGFIADIPVKKNQLIEAGTTLIQVETARFENAVQAAEAELEIAGQGVGAQTAAVATATAKVATAKTKLNEARTQGARLFPLIEKGVIARAQGDTVRATIASAQSEVEAAEAELERAKQLLGDSGEADNPQVRRAVANLATARLNLARTTIRAPVRGFIGGLKIDEGAYVTAGQPAMTFLSIDDIWVEAYMTENNLANVNVGDKVEVLFDALPGEIYSGKVKSSAVGVSTGKKTDYADLPTVEKKRGWLRDPQRFPVVIQVDYEHDMHADTGVRMNSLADVIVYTGDNPFWNALGKFWIRLMSWFSYAY